ncbi:16005_t:CDS:2 [Funneliformis caledonium]|uniref:16005_t:CDS:1 n=1 Tax=Funneliformis caledonium TaxID=1117310 RepID=A0A9N9N4H8_9GLOM|nr:16005_t:CDS:2 [Funneliformis caledonium]
MGKRRAASKRYKDLLRRAIYKIRKQEREIARKCSDDTRLLSFRNPVHNVSFNLPEKILII